MFVDFIEALLGFLGAVDVNSEFQLIMYQPSFQLLNLLVGAVESHQITEH